MIYEIDGNEHSGVCFGALKDGCECILKGANVLEFDMLQYVKNSTGGGDNHPHTRVSTHWLLSNLKSWPYSLDWDRNTFRVQCSLPSSVFLSTCQVARAGVAPQHWTVRTAFWQLTKVHKLPHRVAFMLSWMLIPLDQGGMMVREPDAEEAPVSMFMTFGDIRRYIKGLDIPDYTPVNKVGTYEREDNTSYLCECPYYPDDEGEGEVYNESTGEWEPPGPPDPEEDVLTLLRGHAYGLRNQDFTVLKTILEKVS